MPSSYITNPAPSAPASRTGSQGSSKGLGMRSSTTAANATTSFSRVNSFSRDWGDSSVEGGAGASSSKSIYPNSTSKQIPISSSSLKAAEAMRGNGNTSGRGSGDVNGGRVINLVEDDSEDEEKGMATKKDDEDEYVWSQSPKRNRPINDSSATTSAIRNFPPSAPLSEADIEHAKMKAKIARRAAIMAALQGDMKGESSSRTVIDYARTGAGGVGQLRPATAAAGRSGEGMSAMTGQKRQASPWAADVMKGPKRPTSAQSNISNGFSSAITIKQKVVLSSEQQEVLKLVVEQGKSLFFTGSAGTGKSVLLREIITSLRKKYQAFADAVAVTASTGIAACNIGGVTLHSFGGIGLGVDTPEQMVQKIKRNKKAASRWLRTKVLIIDEISMIDGVLFDKLSKVGSLMRKKPTQPWGGIQIILTGDFFQLPPVQRVGEATFAFEAENWEATISACVNLTKVFRQKDQNFVNMLNEMRFGKMTQSTITQFKLLARGIRYQDGLEATELFPMRHSVDSSNIGRSNSLGTTSWTYTALDGPGEATPQRDKLLENFMAPKSIELKIDSQVMLIKNLDETLVNGSMGKVIGFSHKHVYMEGTDGYWLPNGGPTAEEEDEDLSEIGGGRQKKGKSPADMPLQQPLPVVRFRVPGGTRDMLVDKDIFKSELPNGEIVASRLQVPLILAWAMSIHKSQGQTLERVKVDLSKVFEKGQAYVALSRATSLEGLQVLGFNASKVMAHPKVIEWSKKLVTWNKED